MTTRGLEEAVVGTFKGSISPSNVMGVKVSHDVTRFRSIVQIHVSRSEMLDLSFSCHFKSLCHSQGAR